jgi:hypothetical protein
MVPSYHQELKLYIHIVVLSNLAATCCYLVGMEYGKYFNVISFN